MIQRISTRRLSFFPFLPTTTRLLAVEFPGQAIGPVLREMRCCEVFRTVRECGAHNPCPIDVLTGGFPCQDISVAGCRESNRASRGLRGERSGLFWEVIRILKETQPRWVVLENVVNLLA